MWQQYLASVVMPLVNSKRANASAAAVITAVLVHIGMSHFHFDQNTATVIAMGILAVGGVFVHSQGNADQGKEAVKLLMASPEGQKMLADLLARVPAGIDPKTVLPFLSAFTLGDVSKANGDLFTQPSLVPLEAVEKIKALVAPVVVAHPADGSAPVALTPVQPVSGPVVAVQAVQPGDEFMLPKTLADQVKWIASALQDPGKLSAILTAMPEDVKARLFPIGFPSRSSAADQVAWFQAALATGEDRFANLLRQAPPSACAAVVELLKAIAKNSSAPGNA